MAGEWVPWTEPLEEPRGGARALLPPSAPKESLMSSLRETLQQLPENLRRNVLPVKLINRSLLMRHEHLAGALVELSEMVKTSSRTNGVLHHAPEAFDGVAVMSAVSG